MDREPPSPPEKVELVAHQVGKPTILIARQSVNNICTVRALWPIFIDAKLILRAPSFPDDLQTLIFTESIHVRDHSKHCAKPEEFMSRFNPHNTNTPFANSFVRKFRRRM